MLAFHLKTCLASQWTNQVRLGRADSQRCSLFIVHTPPTNNIPHFFSWVKITLPTGGWISTLSSFPVSHVWNPSHPYESSILHNHLVDKLPADNTPPTPIGIIRTVKFIINHKTIAARTLHEDTSFNLFDNYKGMIYGLNKANAVFLGEKGCILNRYQVVLQI